MPRSRPVRHDHDPSVQPRARAQRPPRTPASDGVAPRSGTRIPTPKHLSLGAFAFVMATGIISVAAQQRGWSLVSLVLLAIAGAGYALLVVLTAWRAIGYGREFLADLRDPRKSFLAFTFVAATDVLAAGVAGHGLLPLSATLLALGATGWLVLGYAIPWIAVLRHPQRPVTGAVNGTWFVWVVAAQSVAVVAATLEPHTNGAREWLSGLAVLAWSVGAILYAAVAMLVVLRMVAHPLDAHEFDPPYWVSMGAIAITVVAGARIVEMSSTPIVDAVRGLIAGASVALWMFATWLIPALVAVGVWRHFVKRVPLRYTPGLWSIVFPLGMYSVAGMYLGRADALPVVATVGEWWIWIAFAGWTVSAIGMVWSWLHRDAASHEPHTADPQATDVGASDQARSPESGS